MTAPLRSAGDSPAPAFASRWGLPAPALLRFVALALWLALAAKLVATALPGSRSGIETIIRRSDTIASVLSQLAVLLGSAELVLLVVATLAEHTLPLVYRAAIVPAAAGVLMLVMLASTMGLEPEASVAIATSALVLALGAAAAAVRFPATRAQGLVLAAVAIGGACRLLARVLGSDGAALQSRATFIATFGYVVDAVAVLLVSARFAAERRGYGRLVLPGTTLLALGVAWSGLRGSLEGATVWQVVASRSLGELTSGSLAVGAIPSRYAIEAFAVVLAGVVVFWPRVVSVGVLSTALALLARQGVDVPVCALALSLGALAAPLGGGLAPRPIPADARGEVAVTSRPAGADG